MTNPIEELRPAVSAIAALYEKARRHVRELVIDGDRIASKKLDRHQLAAHALAYLKTELEASRQIVAWAERVGGELEARIAGAYVGELCRTLRGGVDLGACEHIALSELGIGENDVAETLLSPAVVAISTKYASGDALVALAQDARTKGLGSLGLDETMEAVQGEFRKFVEREVEPIAQDVHRNDVLIPLELIRKMAELGVFGLTIPEEYGGAGFGKVAMCVVTEELSRGYIGVGSLGTRSEIAGELIIGGGTAEQKEKWLPRIASGETIPTAVFTEPNTGSDLASLRTRARRDGDVYRINGNKTWITHAARADVMTLLARTNPDEKGYRGLSMFLAEKPRGRDGDPFPAPGMTGGEIPVLGYRGMKEYELGFDDFEVSAANLLGGEEGNGFKQLMQTFESARIQTAARALGVAQNAMELGLRYGLDRVQFARPIYDFPRVSDKIASMAVEIMVARQLTYQATTAKDEGRRCDLEAGMAKLLAARVAWAAADNALQIHGGNGFALEYPISRVLCDARILNIFEGAGEIQAQVISRRLLEGAN